MKTPGANPNQLWFTYNTCTHICTHITLQKICTQCAEYHHFVCERLPLDRHGRCHVSLLVGRCAAQFRLDIMRTCSRCECIIYMAAMTQERRNAAKMGVAAGPFHQTSTEKNVNKICQRDLLENFILEDFSSCSARVAQLLISLIARLAQLSTIIISLFEVRVFLLNQCIRSSSRF